MSGRGNSSFSDEREQLIDDEPEGEAPVSGDPKRAYDTLLEIEFKAFRREYAVNPRGIELQPGQTVVLEVDRGEDCGVYLRVLPTHCLTHIKVKSVMPILRVATEEDQAAFKAVREKEAGAFEICAERIAARGLEMKLVDAEYQLDGNKITFFFTADHRIDFRELVKDLAAAFRTRIELRQIGVRDEARRVGGYGVCGLNLCCNLWLRGFAPISTQMARDQNVSLNPQKISGVCGRLMCCLGYEEPSYISMAAEFPKVGLIINTAKGEAMVRDVQLLKNSVTLLFEGEEREFLTVPLEEFRQMESEQGQYKKKK